MRTPKDWGQPCPNPECVHYNRMQQGNVSAIATYLTQSGTRRIFRCHTCATQFAETRETVFFDLRTPEDKVMMALKMLLVRVDLAGICFVLGVTEETVLAWLRRAAHQAEAINRHLLRDLPVTPVQLDEMWNFIARKHACETDPAGESLPDGTDGRQWIWVSFAPEFRLMIAAVVGPRTLDTAKEVVAATKESREMLGMMEQLRYNGLDHLPATRTRRISHMRVKLQLVLCSDAGQEETVT